MNSGKVVTIPAEDVTMGDWNGIGYIVTNSETGTGVYMISGGLNGGSTAFVIDFSYMLGMILTTYLLVTAVAAVTSGIGLLCAGIAIASLFTTVIGLLSVVLAIGLIVYACNLLIKWEVLYYDYLLTGNIDEGLYMSADIANEIIDTCKNIVFFGTLCIAAKSILAAYGLSIVKGINQLLRRLTSGRIQKIISKFGISVEEFSELLQYDRKLNGEEQALVNAVRNEIGEIPKDGTVMAKVIPQADIEAYLKGEYSSVGGFVSEAEFSENLKTLEEMYEGNRLDYANTKFSLTDETYGKITYAYKENTEIIIPRYEANISNYPYTGRGFTASKNVILPEWKQGEQLFTKGNILEILDSKAGEVIERYIFDGEKWVIQ